MRMSVTINTKNIMEFMNILINMALALIMIITNKCINWLVYLIIILGVFLTWTTIAAHNFFHMRDNFRMYYFDLSMMSSKNWRISHVMSHHMYTNTVWDYEIYVVEPFLQWIPRKDKSYLAGMISRIISPIVWMFLFVVEGFKRY